MTTEIRNADLPRDLIRKMRGPTPPDDYVSNGCTCSPDFVLGNDVRAACHWHDWAYASLQRKVQAKHPRLVTMDDYTAKTEAIEYDRMEADAAFYHNLRQCECGWFWAMRYFRTVRFTGMDYFTYRPLAMRPQGWRRVYAKANAVLSFWVWF